MQTVTPEKEAKALSIWYDPGGNITNSHEYTFLTIPVPDCTTWDDGEAHWVLETY